MFRVCSKSNVVPSLLRRMVVREPHQNRLLVQRTSTRLMSSLFPSSNKTTTTCVRSQCLASPQCCCSCPCHGHRNTTLLVGAVGQRRQLSTEKKTPPVLTLDPDDPNYHPTTDPYHEDFRIDLDNLPNPDGPWINKWELEDQPDGSVKIIRPPRHPNQKNHIRKNFVKRVNQRRAAKEKHHKMRKKQHRVSHEYSFHCHVIVYVCVHSSCDLFDIQYCFFYYYFFTFAHFQAAMERKQKKRQAYFAEIRAWKEEEAQKHQQEQ